MGKDILSMLPQEIETELEALGEPRYRAGQIFQWLGRGVRDFDGMTNLPKALKEKLKSEYRLYAPKVLSKQVSRLDGTIKYLWELYDGNAVETVVMSYKHGNTVCVSSQVGCGGLIGGCGGGFAVVLIPAAGCECKCHCEDEKQGYKFFHRKKLLSNFNSAQLLCAIA